MTRPGKQTVIIIYVAWVAAIFVLHTVFSGDSLLIFENMMAITNFDIQRQLVTLHFLRKH